MNFIYFFVLLQSGVEFAIATRRKKMKKKWMKKKKKRLKEKKLHLLKNNVENIAIGLKPN